MVRLVPMSAQFYGAMKTSIFPAFLRTQKLTSADPSCRDDTRFVLYLQKKFFAFSFICYASHISMADAKV